MNEATLEYARARGMQYLLAYNVKAHTTDAPLEQGVLTTSEHRDNNEVADKGEGDAAESDNGD